MTTLLRATPATVAYFRYAGPTALTRSEVVAVRRDGRHVTSLTVRREDGEHDISADQVVASCLL